jgi:Arm DNA-binding domain
MTQKLNRLTARKVATATEPGLYADGGGLYLRVGRGGAKSWCLRYMLEGKAREMGLGGLLKVGLADARRRAAAQRTLLVDKIDPLERRQTESAGKKIEAARRIERSGIMRRCRILKLVPSWPTCEPARAPLLRSNS